MWVHCLTTPLSPGRFCLKTTGPAAVDRAHLPTVPPPARNPDPAAPDIEPDPAPSAGTTHVTCPVLLSPPKHGCMTRGARDAHWRRARCEVSLGRGCSCRSDLPEWGTLPRWHARRCALQELHRQTELHPGRRTLPRHEVHTCFCMSNAARRSQHDRFFTCLHLRISPVFRPAREAFRNTSFTMSWPCRPSAFTDSMAQREVGVIRQG